LLDAVAHEFKTPLTSIKAATSTILTSPSITDEQRDELITIVGQESERLSRLMKEMFHLARVESGKLHLLRTRQSIPELVSEAVRQTPNLNGKLIETSYVPSLPAIELDSELFVVALKQLIDNAAKYSPPGSTIKIRARPGAEETLLVSIEDQGPGLPAEIRERVFEKFFRAMRDGDTGDRRRSGTGMGLAIARGIVEAHQGKIWIEDGEGGRGAKFVVSLPIGDKTD